MNLRDLHYLVAVADLRNFSQAALRCHISQPTLSNQIKKLEETLGVTLFERTNKMVLPTEIGKEVIAVARRILREEVRMKELAVQAHNPLSGIFRLAAFPTLSTYVFPKMVPHLMQQLPDMKWIFIEEKTAHIITGLQEGSIDAALLALPIQEDYLESEVLFEDLFYLAVPTAHPLAQEKEIDQLSLKDYPLLLLEEGHCLRDQALEICQTSGAFEQDFRATGLETLRQMVKAGTGITFMPNSAIYPEEAGIAYIPFLPPIPKRSIGLIFRKTSTRKHLHSILIDIIKTHYTSL